MSGAVHKQLVARLKAKAANKPVPAISGLKKSLMVIKHPCKFLGDEKGRAGCSGNKTYTCDLHRETVMVTGACLDIKRTCEGCDDYITPPPVAVHFPKQSLRAISGPSWVSTSDLIADSVRLAAMVPHDCSGIIGIPRSGMIPASVIATHLHLPLLTLNHTGLVTINSGSRGRTLHKGSGKFFVVDDTVYSGAAVTRARSTLGKLPAVYAAVYARPAASGVLDVFAAELECPHLLEWNLLNNGPVYGYAAKDARKFFADGIAVDIDGILIHDEHSGGPMGGAYLTARMHPLKLIATGRNESARTFTEAQLRKLGIKWEKLMMLPNEKETNTANAAAFKAQVFADSRCGVFVESCPTQAEMIHWSSGKPVICPVVKKVFVQS